MKQIFKILLLEDNPYDAKLVQLELSKTIKKFESRVVQDEKNFLNELENFQPDLILSDYAMPQFTGMEALEIAKKKCPEIPFIIVTGSVNEETAIKCMRWGAWDYVIKDKLIHLRHAVTNAIKLKTENEKKKLVEEALKKSEEQFRLIAENTTDNIALVTFDLKAKYVYVSPSVKSVLGYDPEDLLGRSFFGFIHPEDKKLLFPLLKKYVNLKIKKLLIGKESTFSETIEFRFKNKTGNWRFMQSSLNIVGKQLLSVARDITERKQVEEALRKSEEQFRLITENTSDIITLQTFDMKSSYTYVSPSIKALSGYEPEELLGRSAFEFIHPDDKKKLYPQLMKYVNLKIKKLLTGKESSYTETIEYRIKNKSGNWRYAQSTGNIVGDQLLFVTRDITKRKKAEEELRVSEKKYRSLIENIQDGVFIIQDAKLQFVNEPFVGMTGYSVEEMNGMNFKDLVAPEDIDMVADRYHRRQANENIPSEYEFRLLHKDKKTRVIVNMNVSLITYQGRVASMGTLKDITERKRAEVLQKALYNISIALNTTESIDELYRIIRDNLGTVIDTTNFYVALYDEKTDMISLPFDVDKKDDYETFPAGKTLTAYVIRTGKPLLVDDKLLAKLIKEGKVEYIGAPSKIWLGVPLKVENKVIGVVMVQSYDDPHLYAEKDMEILTFVSKEIALAIQHKQSEEQVKRDLEEKEVLLEEVYHRVKNNMQLISSLLKLQSVHITDKRALELFENSRNRVKSMAFIHDALYRSKDMANIDFAKYVKRLTTQISVSYDADSNLVKIKIDIKDVLLDINVGIPCGMIINELVSNSFKYAFPEGRKGEISISLTSKNQVYELCVKDNGIGISGKIDFENPQTLGLLLVSTLTKQLDGILEIEKVKGTSFKITFEKKVRKTYGKV